MPVTGAVHVKVPVTPLARLAIDAGEGPVNAPIVAVPKRVRAAGTIFVTVLPVLFATVIVNVAVSPEKTHVGLAMTGPLTERPIVSRLTTSVLEVALLDVAELVLLRALAIK
jgi:hypothetical protein